MKPLPPLPTLLPPSGFKINFPEENSIEFFKHPPPPTIAVIHSMKSESDVKNMKYPFTIKKELTRSHQDKDMKRQVKSQNYYNDRLKSTKLNN